MPVTWKVVTASTPDALAKQLTALTAAGFVVHTILQSDDQHQFTIVAYASP